MSHGTYIHTMIYGILNYAIETYIWNEVGKNEQQYLTIQYTVIGHTKLCYVYVS